MLTVVPDLSAVRPAGQASPVIEQIVRVGARQMLAAARGERSQTATEKVIAEAV
jgi:hypothetical protein